MDFREEQRMLQSWILRPVIALVVLLGWWGFIQQVVLGRPWGSNPGPDWVLWMMLPIFGIGFPLFFMSLRLIVQVRSDHLDIRFKPLAHRKISFTEIERVEPRTYQPVKEYGGWGIKGWSRRKIAFSVSGNQGVDLHLRNGSSVMIGSRDAAKLALELEKAMKRAESRTGTCSDPSG